jgi:hypothetical protein
METLITAREKDWGLPELNQRDRDSLPGTHIGFYTQCGTGRRETHSQALT